MRTGRERGPIWPGRAADAFGVNVSVRRDPDAAVTAFGPLPYIIEFLKANGIWRQWVKGCLLAYSSPNTPPNQDILDTIL